MKNQERVVASVPVGARSFLRIAIVPDDATVVVRKFTRNGERIFIPTGLTLKLANLTEASDFVAGITKASAEAWK